MKLAQYLADFYNKHGNTDAHEYILMYGRFSSCSEAVFAISPPGLDGGRA